MPTLLRDYETRGVLNLLDVGAWRYATHPNTDVLCCAYCADDGPVKLWVPGDPIPPEFIEAASNPEWIVSAFNDNFERQIEAHILAPRYGWPIIPIERHRCLQASARSLALPGKLEKVAKALGLKHQKDEDGHRNMLDLAKPRKRRKGEPLGIYWHDDPARFRRLYDYCIKDGEVEQELQARIGFITPEEQAVWQLDAAINDNGVYLDNELAEGAIKIDQAAHDELNTELSKITDGAVKTTGQEKELKKWLAANGCAVDNIQKGTLGHALTRKHISAEARRVIELRLAGAHAAVDKYTSAMDWRNNDGRMRGCFEYHGCSTGRWSSHGIQLQNMKKAPPGGVPASAIGAVKTGNIAHMRAVYPEDDPLSIVGNIVRAVLCAAPGHVFIDADLSGIESRALADLANEQSKLDQWAKFDETGLAEDEPYFILGAGFGVPPDQLRFTGKTGDLAFGFAGSVGAYRKFAPDDPASDATIKGYQQAWQRAHPATVKFWADIWNNAIEAVMHPGQVFEVNSKISWRCDEDSAFLRMHLPSGRRLAYPFPRLIEDDRGYLILVHKDYVLGKWVDVTHFGRPGTWKGQLTENAVQAVARDIFAGAMPRLEAAGYRIVLHAHDEIVAEVPQGFGSVEEFIQIITMKPTWAPDLPLAAKGDVRERFCRTKTDEPREAHDPPPENNDADEKSGNDTVGTVSKERETMRNRDGYPIGGNGQGNGQDHADYTYGPSYIYRDKNGLNFMRTTRRTNGNGEKSFPQQHWENGKWMPGKPKAPKILYRLPELLATPNDVPIWVCEGEKDAESVAALGFVATTNSEGATRGKWTPGLNIPFAGRETVYILEDNDETGRNHVAEVANNLRPFVDEIRIVDFRDEVPEHGDVSDWLNGGGYTREDLLERAKAGREPLKIIGFNPADWASDPEPEERKWIVPDYILDLTTTMLSGDGGTGKSYLAHQLTIARALVREWLRLKAAPGKTLYLSCEDDLAEMKRRQRGILGFYDAVWSDLGDNVRLIDLVGEDSILALLEKGIIKAAPMYQALDAYMTEFKPGLTIIDVLAAVFAGNEVVRTEVRQFANLLNGLCKKHKSAILLLAHPSLAGMSSGSGLSGSTDWSNGFRCRAYLETVANKNGDDETSDNYRVFKGMKSNYGKKGGKITLEWKSGLYVPVCSEVNIEKVLEIDAMFMEMVKRFNAQDRNASDKAGRNYAPVLFAAEPDNGGFNKEQFEAAMRRLLLVRKIRIENHGPKWRPERTFIPFED